MTMSMISGCDDFVRACAVRFLLSDFFFSLFFFFGDFRFFFDGFRKEIHYFFIKF